jgi:hypothetical protein
MADRIGRASATAAAIDSRCVSEIVTMTPSASARSAAAPCSATALTPVKDLDVERIEPVQPEGLHNASLAAARVRAILVRADSQLTVHPGGEAVLACVVEAITVSRAWIVADRGSGSGSA